MGNTLKACVSDHVSVYSDLIESQVVGDAPFAQANVLRKVLPWGQPSDKVTEEVKLSPPPCTSVLSVDPKSRYICGAHKSATSTKKTTCEVAVHFNKEERQISDFEFIVIEQICNIDDNHNVNKRLLTREAFWCSQLSYALFKLMAFLVL